MFWTVLLLGAVIGILLTLAVQTLAIELDHRRELRRTRLRQRARGIPMCSLGMGEAPSGVLNLLKSEARKQSHDQR